MKFAAVVYLTLLLGRSSTNATHPKGAWKVSRIVRLAIHFGMRDVKRWSIET